MMDPCTCMLMCPHVHVVETLCLLSTPPRLHGVLNLVVVMASLYIATTQQLFNLIEAVNTFSKCSTEGCQGKEGCEGKLRHVSTRLIGLGGDCEVVFKDRQVTYPTSPMHGKSRQPTLCIALQVTSICTGPSYAQYKCLFLVQD